MDRTTKTAIKKLVLSLRRLLEDDIEVVLKRYGLFTDRAWLPTDKIPKSDKAVLAARQRMEAAIAVEQARGLTPGEATGWYIREVAFTYLNRLVGLKCLEVRGLIDEVITTRVEYGGRSLFHRDFRHAHPDLAAQPDDALPAALEAACRHVTNEMIGVLFDPDSENSVVWPRYQTLRQAIALINDLPAETWAEDEIIGWVYQFYNAEEKERIRKRGKPQLPIEVAVINQFFTPRWVVKFLVDNTLGRLWLEMHPDSERVRVKCDYLVPEPLPSPSEGEGPAERVKDGKQGIALDPDSPINNPDAPPRRDPRLVTEIRLIDPACGTMHFGYYAFEVFQEIYLDSLEHGWPIANRKSKIQDHEIPALILGHNLYGVDIDLRAVQLAALSLYMKARLAERKALTRITDHEPQIKYRVNLVCADARLTDGEIRARFLKEYEDDPALQRVWRELFQEMEDIAQVGSLLRVEERFRQLLQEYRPSSVALDAERQLALDGLPQPPRQMRLAEVKRAYAWSPCRTLADMLEHLRRFARDALEEADVNAQLFAAEAEKTLGLLDVLLQDYDVVVMNPPYGVATQVAKKYLKKAYPLSWNDLGTAFVERALDLCASGFVGPLTSRTFMFLTRLEKFRKGVIQPKIRLVTLADLGREVLDDAMVETAAYVAGGKSLTMTQSTLFFRLVDFGGDEKQIRLEISLGANNTIGRDDVVTFAIKQERFAEIPGMTFAYWAPESIFDLFEVFPSFGPTFGDVRPGLTTRDNERFLRHWWEVCPRTVGKEKKWIPFAKGGGYSPFYYDNDLLLLWENDGSELREFITSMGDPETKFIANQEYYFREGLTYPRVTDKGFNVRYLSGGHIFAEKGISIFFEDPNLIWPSLAWLNSAAVQYLLLLMTASRSWEKSHVSSLPFPLAKRETRLGGLAREAHDLKRSWDGCNEISNSFEASWLIQACRGNLLSGTTADGQPLTAKLDLPQLPDSQSTSLLALLDYVRAVEQAADVHLEQLQAQIDEAVYDLYEITPKDRALIERELGDRPPELVWPQMEGKSDKEKRREHVRRLLSYFVLQTLKLDQDGILCLVEGTGEPTVLERLRERLEATFGVDVAFQLEDEVGQVLGKSVDRWLEGDFIKWHTQLYKRRPIIWHVTSPGRTFGAFVYYHKLDGDTLPKVRNVYLRMLRDQLGKQLEEARSAEDYKAVDRLETALDDLTVLDERLGSISEAGYDPVIDDGVKANILPLQEAEVLRYKRVV